MKRSQISNIRFLNIVILFFALILITKLGHIQIYNGEYYKNLAESKYHNSTTSTFDRGSIFFEERTGRRISAATVVPDYTLIVDPTKINDKEALADKLLTIIKFDRADFITRVGRKNDKYEEVAKHLSDKDVERIRALNERSITIEDNRKRFYPGGKVAAQLLGFVGSDGNSTKNVGRYGLEQFYDDVLTRSGGSESSGFFADLFLKPEASILFDRGREGDLVTTIEPTVQGLLERVLLEDVVKKYNATSAGGIIMNPMTGEIYAMATMPTFDPNNFSKEKDQSVFANPLISGLYEMGSIIKPLTMAAGIDAGVVTANTVYDDKGFRVINTERIKNFDGKARGVVNMQEVLSQSLNTGTIFVQERLGKDRFREYFKLFSLGEETGIDLPNESAGDIHNLDSALDVDYATASFGQGISMTPIAAIRALASLANGGVLVSPHVVKLTQYGIGPSREFIPTNERRVIKKETAKEISRMLTVSMDKTLLDGRLKLPHYSVAVKTGTAQIASKGGYSETDSLHTFVGYFPSNNPKFIILLVLKNPQSKEYASQTLSLPFMQITNFLLNYYQVPPDR